MDDKREPMQDDGSAGEPPLSKELRQRQDEHVDRVWELYNARRPMYPRELLEELHRQLDEQSRRTEFLVTDFEGVRRSVPLWTFEHEGETWDQPRIVFRSLQWFVDASPFLRDPDLPLFPISISASRHQGPRQSDTSASELTCAWDAYMDELAGSETWRLLEATLSSAAQPRRIDKIVGFGLGAMASVEGSRGVSEEVRGRACMQHALVLALARLLELRTGVAVECYVQDPAYTDSCEEALASKGIAVVEPERGFLAVDEATLVFAVAPNVPVRQIVADMARPAAMIWSPVEPGEDDKWEWVRREDGVWICPYTTDPDSPRLRDMVKGYARLPFPADDKYFGRLAVYIRKDEDGPHGTA